MAGVPEPVVVTAGGAGTLLAVVSLTWPRVNTNISTSARTTAPATQPHIAFDGFQLVQALGADVILLKRRRIEAGVAKAWVGHAGLLDWFSSGNNNWDWPGVPASLRRIPP